MSWIRQLPSHTRQCRHSHAGAVTNRFTVRIVQRSNDLIRQAISVGFRSFQDRYNNRLLTPLRRRRHILTEIFGLLVGARELGLIGRPDSNVLAKNVDQAARAVNVRVRRVYKDSIHRSSVGLTNSNGHQQGGKLNGTRSDTRSLHGYNFTYAGESKGRRRITTIRRSNSAPTGVLRNFTDKDLGRIFARRLPCHPL